MSRSIFKSKQKEYEPITIHEPMVNGGRNFYVQPVALTNGHFLLYDWYLNDTFYLYSSKTRVWKRVIWNQKDEFLFPIALSDSVKFGIFYDENHKKLIQFWVVFPSMVQPHLLVFELNYETAQMVLKTRYELDTVTTNCSAIYYMNEQFHFLYSYPGHKIYDANIQHTIYDNIRNYHATELMQIFNTSSYMYAPNNKKMVISHSDQLYIWNNPQYKWIPLKCTIPVPLANPLIMYTADGNHIIILGGKKAHTSTNISYNDEIFIVDLLKERCYSSIIKIPGFQKTTRCVLVSNSLEDELVTVGFIRKEMISFPDDLLHLLIQFIGTEYLHVIHSFIINIVHQKIAIEYILKEYE